MVELLSLCCGAEILSEDKDHNGRCAECKENTGPDTRCTGCEEDMTLKQYINQDGICEQCAWLADK